ncbi:unnamed protein product [Pleuronectes platessa]|uniref:Uncharacterized protein n=1 Tax=Pleuronectes platessa TaxID=8262 RepID=A0A9N7VH49_PLEPL|nr:unnamed protein product [Pleuronectes platessa]
MIGAVRVGGRVQAGKCGCCCLYKQGDARDASLHQDPKETPPIPMWCHDVRYVAGRCLAAFSWVLLMPSAASLPLLPSTTKAMQREEEEEEEGRKEPPVWK